MSFFKINSVLSNCCQAAINNQDANGHGQCYECGENCVPHKRKRIKKAVLVWSTAKICLFWVILFLTSCATPKAAHTPTTYREVTTDSPFVIDAVFYDEARTLVIWTHYQLTQTGHTMYIDGDNWQSGMYEGIGRNYSSSHNEITFRLSELEYQDFKKHYEDIRLTISIPTSR